MEIAVDTNCFIPEMDGLRLPDGTAVIEDWALNGGIVKPVYSKDIKIAGIQAGNGFTKTMAYRTAESVVKSELDKVIPEPNAFYNEFYDVVVDHKEPLIRSSEVMNVMKIMEAAKRSAKENQVITIARH
ncbi:MAG: hypothetical protein ACLRTQ_08415 [Candidatus Borkfalkia sp.]